MEKTSPAFEHKNREMRGLCLYGFAEVVGLHYASLVCLVLFR